MSSPYQKTGYFSLATVSLMAYLILIAYASLYPFTGWHFENLSTYRELMMQWPRYWPQFDIIINVVGYIPLGFLLVFSLGRHCSIFNAVIFTILLSAFISWGMESLQFFLPSRFTSLLDFLMNTLGSMLGAIVGGFIYPYLSRNAFIHRMKTEWQFRYAPREILLVALWPLANLFPQTFLFGLGHMSPVISLGLEEYWDIEFDMSQLFYANTAVPAETYLMIEMLITATACTGAILLCLSLLSNKAPKLMIASGLLFLSLLIKTLSCGVMFQPENAFIWLTPSAQGGLMMSGLMLSGFAFMPQTMQKKFAFLFLLISLMAINLTPNNPYFANTLQTLMQNKMLNFYGAAQFLGLVWPFIVLFSLLNPSELAASPDAHASSKPQKKG